MFALACQKRAALAGEADVLRALPRAGRHAGNELIFLRLLLTVVKAGNADVSERLFCAFRSRCICTYVHIYCAGYNTATKFHASARVRDALSRGIANSRGSIVAESSRQFPEKYSTHKRYVIAYNIIINPRRLMGTMAPANKNRWRRKNSGGEIICRVA